MKWKTNWKCSCACWILSQNPSRCWYLDLPAALSIYLRFVEVSGCLVFMAFPLICDVKQWMKLVKPFKSLWVWIPGRRLALLLLSNGCLSAVEQHSASRLYSSEAEDAAQSDKSTIKTAKLNTVSSLNQSGPHFVSTEAHSFSLKCLNVAAP